MKSFLFFLFAIIQLGVFAQPECTISEPVYKFPKTNEGTFLEHEFIVKNTGNAPLIISDYAVQCTCTKVILPSKPILPGESFKLKVTFDTNGKYYFQDRTIELTTNTKKRIHKVRFKVNVVPKA